MDNTILLQILLQIILIALNAIFACAEIAVISINDNKLDKMAHNGDKRAKRLKKLTNEPAKFLATIQVAITLSGFLGSAFAAENFSDKLVNWVVSLGVNVDVKTLDTIALIVITLILSYFTLVFGELVPKRLAMKKAEQLALLMSSLISFISKIFAPIVFILTASTNVILKLFGIDPNAEDDEVSEEEIRMMVDVGSQKGVIDVEEKEIIQNVFEFDNITVDEFSTHRTDISLLWLDESVEEWENIINNTRHSIYPICNETVDKVVGLLKVKDFFATKDKSKENILNTVVKPAYFVPETIYADVLFKQMKQTRNHFAIVLDEYGGTSGIVTMNDLLEQLVGDLEDEVITEDEPSITALDEYTWMINGSIELDEVFKTINQPIPSDKYETFGGFVFNHYGSIPDDGNEFEITINNIHIKVLKISEHKIQKAIISIVNV